MKIQLTLSGPFLTTKILDPQRLGGTNGNLSLLRAAYADVQNRLSKCLLLTDSSWSDYDGAVEVDTDYDGKSYTGSSIFPEFLAQSTLTTVDLLDAFRRWDCGPLTNKFALDASCGLRLKMGTLNISSCRIKIHDFGVGIVEIDLLWTGIGTETIGEVKQEIDALITSFASFSSILAGSKLQQFLGCLDSFPDIGEVFTAMSPGASSKYSASRPKVLWIHRIYAVTAQDWIQTETELVNELLESHHVNPFEDASINPSVCFYPSIGGSLAFFKAAQQGDSIEFAGPLRAAISLQNAYNAGMWMFDDVLFGRTVELMGGQDQIVYDNVKLEGLMNHAHSILRLSSYISTFLSVLHNRISRSSPQQTILIEHIYYAWRMDVQRSALENKLTTLKEMYQGTLRVLADSEARSLNKLVFLFTLLSLVSVVTTVADFAVKLDDFHGFSIWRASLVVGSAFLVVAVAIAVRRFKHRVRLRRMSVEADIFDGTKFQKLVQTKK